MLKKSIHFKGLYCSENAHFLKFCWWNLKLYKLILEWTNFHEDQRNISSYNTQRLFFFFFNGNKFALKLLRSLLPNNSGIIHKNIFFCLFSVHIRKSLSRHEQVCLMTWTKETRKVLFSPWLSTIWPPWLSTILKTSKKVYKEIFFDM